MCSYRSTSFPRYCSWKPDQPAEAAFSMGAHGAHETPRIDPIRTGHWVSTREGVMSRQWQSRMCPYRNTSL